MVLCCDLKLATRCVGSGANFTWERLLYRPRSFAAYALPGATFQELQSNLWLAFTFAGLEAPWKVDVENQVQLPPVPSLGPLSKRHREY